MVAKELTSHKKQNGIHQDKGERKRRKEEESVYNLLLYFMSFKQFFVTNLFLI